MSSNKSSSSKSVATATKPEKSAIRTEPHYVGDVGGDPVKQAPTSDEVSSKELIESVGLKPPVHDHCVVATLPDGMIRPIWCAKHNRNMFTKEEAVETAERYSKNVPDVQYIARSIEEEQKRVFNESRQPMATVMPSTIEALNSTKDEAPSADLNGKKKHFVGVNKLFPMLAAVAAATAAATGPSEPPAAIENTDLKNRIAQKFAAQIARDTQVVDESNRPAFARSGAPVSNTQMDDNDSKDLSSSENDGRVLSQELTDAKARARATIGPKPESVLGLANAVKNKFKSNA